MQEIKADFWAIASQYDAICVTTNGIVKQNGELVMGAGIAKDFKNRFDGLALKFGALVKEYGNRAVRVRINGTNIVSLPTKNNYKDDSDLNLIIRSVTQISQMADKFGWKRVLLTRPGCGLGNLSWQTVKASIETILDDRFYVVS